MPVESLIVAKRSTSKVCLVHWNLEEARERLDRLRDAGFDAWHAGMMGPKVVEALRANPPAAIVIDLSRLPSHGREVAVHFRKHMKTRQAPLVFVDGEAEKVERIRSILPDATYTTWPRTKAIESPRKDLVIPKDAMAAYSGTPLPKKLGIKTGSVVALIGAPDDFGQTLGDLPDGAACCYDDSNGACDLTIWFVRSAKDLKGGMRRAVKAGATRPVWIAWPKKASGALTDVNETLVRASGLSAGLVDYKICSIDATWSGLLFRMRKAK
jgi:CheY-like chemotaxis protein